ncbi:hypothetical protein [Magnetospirillum sp. LM-5]|uniref:hypothetical protein n=1 Tax=Magnetospirillum sp. LM-5 TaxID=2681466 RepID=UPI001570DD1B|nr:hypothetical protein [Magnetospirillum sp. LM-5]
MKPNQVATIKNAIKLLPDLAASRAGHPPSLEQVFCPPGHHDALDPRRTLVIGNRGMGKSFWAGALSQPKIRERVADTYKASGKLYDLERHKVFVAFPETVGNTSAPDKEILKTLGKKVPWETVWRVVVAKSLSKLTSIKLPLPLKEAVAWARSNPEAMKSLFREADASLERKGSAALILFDELDQLADDWRDILEITQGILRCALALKKYNNIRAKIFMRPDQASNKGLFQFPDASKIYGERVVLEWENCDLYGLFFHHLMRAPDSAPVVASLVGKTNAARLTYDPAVQRETFALLAGEFMGQDPRRGVPYSWVPTHLADGYGEVSPRAFLKAVKVASTFNSGAEELVFTPEALQDGVRQASGVRVAEIGEDYPWVPDALAPLRGILVPCDPPTVLTLWKHNGTVEDILTKYRGIRAPLELAIAQLLDQDEEESLKNALAEIGVLEIRDNGKLNFPDIFRIGAGIKRRGGVPPQRRRH